MSSTISDKTNNGVTYRFKNLSETIELLQRFALVHNNDDDREEYNDAWDTFYDSHHETFEREKQRHLDLGFKGKFEHKMYISARYYYSKKCALLQVGEEKQPEKQPEGEEKQQEVSKRKYEKINPGVHDEIEKFLSREKNHSLKPAIAWNKFCVEYGDEFCEKKTFKNRLYNIVNSKKHHK